MQESDERDTCRICSGPSEEDQPLFHPCKCSGTIRYIHQECLTTWLAHSKKKTCDVCKHPYSFTKVYAQDMPTRIPIYLLVRRFAEQSFFVIIFGIRATLVGFMWLAILPLVTVWTWRMYFALGNNLAWWVSKLPRQEEPPSPSNSTSLFTSFTNSTTNLSLLNITSHPTWQTLWSDIFVGQIIASLIVVTFVSVFLLREWIAQNARPGIFEDEEDEVLLAAEANANPVPIPEALPFNPPPEPEGPPPLEPIAPVDFAERIVVARRQLDELRARNAQEGAQGPVLPPDTPSPPREARNGAPPLRDSKGKGKESDEASSSKMEGSPALMVPAPLPQIEFSFRHPPPSEFVPILPPRRSLSEPKLQYSATPFSLAPPSSYSQVPTPRFEGADSDIPRRPPLPATALPTASPMFQWETASPLASPSLATYSAPEELQPQAGPSQSHPSYFETGPSIGEDVFNAQEYGHYFEDLEEKRRLDDDVHAELLFISDSDEDRRGGFPQRGAGRSASDLGSDRPEPQALEDTDEDDEEGDTPQEEEDGAEGREIEPGGLGERLDPAGLPPALAPQPQPLPPPEQPAPAAPAEEDNDVENLEDDMEGAMEAIGLRGPFFAVIQNAALMIFILDTAIGLGVFIPFTVGKSTALLSLNPPRLLQLVHLPIRTIRVLTDPFVDSFMYLATRFVVPRLAILANNCFRWIISSITSTFGERTSEQVEAFFSRSMEALNTMMSSSPVNTTAPVEKAETILTFPTWMEPVEPFFATIGKETRSRAINFYANWSSLSEGQGPMEATFAVALGYVVISLALAIYLNVLTVGNVRSAGKAVRGTVRQQLLVVKVAGFIFVELVTFPLVCGMVLDLCTIWLFRDTSLDTRLSFLMEAPLTSVFYHWVAGTFFMYSFAILLSGCRTIMRPGAMWFVKDPQDQNTHPIRDILERPTLTQMRKIALSGVMYSFVVFCVVATTAGLMVLGRGVILPFRWKTREPLSDVPVDLLFLHFALPYTMKYFRPKRVLKTATTKIWKFLTHQLRLTSYFFGGRYPDEEYTPTQRFAPGVAELQQPPFDGNFRRVPATDNIALGREMRATAAVNPDGTPLDDEAKELIDQQNAEIEKAKGNVTDDYTVVYIPPQFRFRIIAFIAALWSIGSLCLGLAIAIPILIGRGFFAMFINKEVHDGYAMLAGTYLVATCYLITTAIDKLDKRRQRSREDGPRGDLRILVAKRGLVWLAKATYMFGTVGILLPILLAVVIDLYLILPVRLAIDPQMTLRIRVVDSWALGSLYAKIGWQLYRMQPHNREQHRLVRGLRGIVTNGWLRPDPIAATTEFIGPAFAGLAGMILLPAGAYMGLQHFVPFFKTHDGRVLFTQVYPGIFAVAGLLRTVAVTSQLYGSWAQSIRDTEFLVEMRLKNHDPDRKKGLASDVPEGSVVVDTVEEDVGDVIQ